MKKECYIVDGVRSPIGRFGGSLSTLRTDDLAAVVIKELILKFPQIDTETISDVILGCANQAGEDNRNIARMATLLAGLSWKVPGETVNRLCASGLAACCNAYRAIRNDEGDLYIAGGVENMTRSPWVISKTSSPFGRDAEMADSSFGWRFINPKMKSLYGTEAMGETAENLAKKYQLTRDLQDRFALSSQQKAAKAIQSGRFKSEICSITVSPSKNETKIFDQDEFVKADTTIEGLQKLKPAFKKIEDGGSITAGNSSGLNDGAAALLLSSESGLAKNNLKPLAKIISSAVAGVEPTIMGIGPVPASALALQRANLTLNDMDIIELNEAFAAQSLACLKEWDISDTDSRLNINGGAIALGHPLGMSGARLMLTAAKELQLKNKKYALITMCIGVGQGYAAIIERV